MNFGVIVVGYPGIGKSTLANSDYRFIDLESNSFFIGDNRPNDWYVYYSNIAIHLAEQGYVVFTSSHKVVQSYLNSLPLPNNVKLICCIPSLNLETYWIDKLWNRWKMTSLYKDFKAYSSVQCGFVSDITEMKNTFEIVCEITGKNYDLYSLLEYTFKQNGIDAGIYKLGIKQHGYSS